MSGTVPQRYHALQTTISKLWRASLVYQTSKTLQLVRLHKSNDCNSAAPTTLATLPEELFQHVLYFSRMNILENYEDSYPYYQECKCMSNKKIWKKSITLETFDNWARREHNHHDDPTTIANFKANKSDPTMRRLYEAFEASDDWREILVPIRMEGYYHCVTCRKSWINTWLHLSDRTEEGDVQAEQAKSIISRFLLEHGIELLQLEDRENWYEEDEEDEIEIEQYCMTMVSAGDIPKCSSSIFAKDTLINPRIHEALSPKSLALQRFAIKQGLVERGEVNWIETEIVESIDDEGQEAEGQAETTTQSVQGQVLFGPPYKGTRC